MDPRKQRLDILLGNVLAVFWRSKFSSRIFIVKGRRSTWPIFCSESALKRKESVTCFIDGKFDLD